MLSYLHAIFTYIPSSLYTCMLSFHIHIIISNFLPHEVSGIVIPREVRWLIWSHKQMKDRTGISTRVSLSNPLYTAMHPAFWHIFSLLNSWYLLDTAHSIGSGSLIPIYFTFALRKLSQIQILFLQVFIHPSRRMNKSTPLIGIQKRLLLLFLLN